MIRHEENKSIFKQKLKLNTKYQKTYLKGTLPRICTNEENLPLMRFGEDKVSHRICSVSTKFATLPGNSPLLSLDDLIYL